MTSNFMQRAVAALGVVVALAVNSTAVAAAPPKSGARSSASGRARPASGQAAPDSKAPAESRGGTTQDPPSAAPQGSSNPGPSPTQGEAPPKPEGESGKSTHYQFTGLDIDGELRTPALLQFLSRIGGEFETMGIPHRSFMPELQATTSEDAL